MNSRRRRADNHREKQSAPGRPGPHRSHVAATALRPPKGLPAGIFSGLKEESDDSNQAKQNAQDIRDTVRGKDSEGDPAQGKQAPHNHWSFHIHLPLIEPLVQPATGDSAAATEIDEFSDELATSKDADILIVRDGGPHLGNKASQVASEYLRMPYRGRGFLMGDNVSSERQRPRRPFSPLHDKPEQSSEVPWTTIGSPLRDRLWHKSGSVADVYGRRWGWPNGNAGAAAACRGH